MALQAGNNHNHHWSVRNSLQRWQNVVQSISWKSQASPLMRVGS